MLVILVTLVILGKRDKPEIGLIRPARPHTTITRSGEAGGPNLVTASCVGAMDSEKAAQELAQNSSEMPLP